jgi:enterochelin esterase family protein
VTSREPPVSPRLAGLQHELEAGSVASVVAFWHEVAQQGTPLIEPIEGDGEHVLVTFLWRAAEAIENVVVVLGLAGLDYRRNQMARLLDTDIWYKSYRSRMDARFTYLLSPNDALVPVADAEDREARIATWQPDPLNPHTYEAPFPKTSVVELPGAPPQPWITPQPGVPKGQIERCRLRSDILNNERDIRVYTPPAYSAEGELYGLLILFDGGGYPLIPVPTILDNLVGVGRLPPLVAVMPENPDEETRARELACHPPFVDFLTQELLPWASGRYHITADPIRTVVGGFSCGGLAAAFAGLRRPDVFGNILSQSGWFSWKPGEPASNREDMEHEWLATQFAESPRLPLRFYLEVGLLENNPSLHNGSSSLISNRHLRNVLRAKGYSVQYTEFNGGHDCLCWRGTLADGLLALMEKDGQDQPGTF